MARPFRKPLVVMTPKSLLRHKLAVSKAEDFQGESHFMRILSDTNAPADKDVKRLILCSGKIAYDLMEARDVSGDKNTSIVRIEQLYPFPTEPLIVRLKRMTNLEELVWAQEEPRNAGSWSFVDPYLEECLIEANVGPTRARYAGRRAAAATATGLAKRHQAEQAALVAEALGHNVREEIRRQRSGGKKPITPPSA
jgi:2-oxoglutarate dehydrogenase E1 component